MICNYCGGSGFILVESFEDEPGNELEKEKCNRCEGTGEKQ